MPGTKKRDNEIFSDKDLFMLGSFTLSEAEKINLEEKEFEILTTAKQYDWRYDDFQYEEKMMKEAVDNFNNNVMGIEIAVDLNHDNEKKALAWITPKSMRVDDSKILDGHKSIFCKLYRYTPKGENFVTTGTIRYFSLEIRHKFTRWIGKTKKVFKNVISGLALTNAPVIKDMAPTFSENNNNNLYHNSINMETIKKLLSDLNSKDIVTKAEKDLLKGVVSVLSEEQAEEVKEDVEKVEDKPEQSKEEIKEAEEKAKKEDEEKELAEKKEEERVKTLSNSERKLAEQTKELAEQKKELAEIKAKQLSDRVETQVKSMLLSETNTQGFNAESKETLETFLFSLSEIQSTQFTELVKGIKSVEMGAKGSSSNQTLSTEEAQHKAAEALVAKGGFTYSEAIIEVTPK